MSLFIHLIASYGLAFVFACVLVEQAGVPLPAYPVLLVAGSLIASRQLSWPAAEACAVAGCIVADSLWYVAGRRHGTALLRIFCTLSITPDSCVRRTRSAFTRWGPRSLALAKFIPGFGSVATVLAGATGVGAVSFLVYDAIGAALWAGIGLALGHLFAPVVADMLDVLQSAGKWGILLLASAMALSLAIKVWRKRQVQAGLRMERISVDALAQLLAGDTAPVVIDVRSTAERSTGCIPGAVALDGDGWPAPLSSAHADEMVVVYCDCPHETTATLTARKLMAHGFMRVRPLAGGMAAWRAAGLAVE